jgi:Creatinine amidohydrolase
MAVDIPAVRDVVERVCTRKEVLDACRRRDLGAVISVLRAHGITRDHRFAHECICGNPLVPEFQGVIQRPVRPVHRARQVPGVLEEPPAEFHELAGEIETSILLHAHPELVREGYHAADRVADDRRHLLTTGMGEYTRSGVIGRPSLATAEKGKAVLASLVDSFVSVLEILQRA